LCDHCRTLQCHTLTAADASDLTRCIRLGCPEHSVPGGPPVEYRPVPF